MRAWGWGVLPGVLALGLWGAAREGRAAAQRGVAHEVVVLAAGDIGECSLTDLRRTAALLDSLPGEVLALGDEAYPNGSAWDFAHCYAPNWGRQRARTHPVPGNHEYTNPAAKGYFGYFGAAAGTPGKGWYSFDLGSWHLIALNSEVDASRGSEQERWLRDDLRRHRVPCVLAYWHEARFSSGRHGSSLAVAPLWDDLSAAHADVVLQAHDHDYERFDPLDSAGRPSPHGIRSFVVGTGGGLRHGFGPPLPGSVVRTRDHVGVLRLALGERSYRWEFLPVDAPRTGDRGEGSCH